MNFRTILVIYGKELRETLRDKRTILSAIIIPLILFPVLIFGFSALAAKSVLKAQKEGFTVMVLGAENAPQLIEAIRKTDGITIVPGSSNYVQRINDKKLRAAIEFPPGLEKSLTIRTNNPPQIKIYHYAAEMRSQFAVRAIQKALREASDRVVEQRLNQRGLSRDLLKPFEIREENVAAPEKVGGNILGGLIPYMIIFLSFMGAVAPAIDLTAGEKERGTVETILATPVSRTEIVMGKFFLVLTVSVVTTIISLVSFGATFSLPFAAARELGRIGSGQFSFNISPIGMASVFFLVLPLAVMFAGGLLAVALLAKSYKEAQTYIAPLMILVIMPAMAAMLPGNDLNLPLAFIPVLNVSLVSKELLTGNYPWPLIAIVFGSSCLYAMAALSVAVAMFKRESVLFRA